MTTITDSDTRACFGASAKKNKKKTVGKSVRYFTVIKIAIGIATTYVKNCLTKGNSTIKRKSPRRVIRTRLMKL